MRVTAAKAGTRAGVAGCLEGKGLYQLCIQNGAVARRWTGKLPGRAWGPLHLLMQVATAHWHLTKTPSQELLFADISADCLPPWYVARLTCRSYAA